MDGDWNIAPGFLRKADQAAALKETLEHHSRFQNDNLTRRRQRIHAPKPQLERQWTSSPRARPLRGRAGADANMMPLRPQIVSSRARSGKRTWEDKLRAVVTLSRRSTRAGVRKNHSATRQLRQTAQSYERLRVRTCRGSTACRHHGGSRPQAHSAFCCARSRARSKAGARSGLAEDCLANRRYQRASLAATRSHISRLHRCRSAAAADYGAQCCLQDGQGDRRITKPRESFVSARGCAFKGENGLVYCVPAGRSRLPRLMAPAREPDALA